MTGQVKLVRPGTERWQNVRIWTAIVLTETRPKSVQIDGSRVTAVNLALVAERGL